MEEKNKNELVRCPLLVLLTGDFTWRIWCFWLLWWSDWVSCHITGCQALRSGFGIHWATLNQTTTRFTEGAKERAGKPRTHLTWQIRLRRAVLGLDLLGLLLRLQEDLSDGGVSSLLLVVHTEREGVVRGGQTPLNPLKANKLLTFELST